MYNADKVNHTCSNRFPALITGEKRESGVAKFWQQQAILTVFLCLLQSISPTDPMTGHSQGHNFDDLRRNKRLHDPNTPKYPCLKRHFCISLQLPHQFRHSYWYGGWGLYGGGAFMSIQFPPQFVHTGAYAWALIWIGA